MESLHTADDKDLVNLSLSGNINAYDEIVRRYQQGIAQTLYRFCPNQSDLEDLVQESLIKGYRKLDKWKSTVPLEAWLRKIAINCARDFLRKQKSRYENSIEFMEYLHSNEKDSKNDLNHINYTESVQNILSYLPAEDRSLLTLHYLEEMPLKDIANIFNWSLAKAKIKSYRAKLKLKKVISNYEAL